MAASHENDLLIEKIIGFGIEVHRQLAAESRAGAKCGRFVFA
jgi:hypothetical protein